MFLSLIDCLMSGNRNALMYDETKTKLKGNFQPSNEFSIIHKRKFIVCESIKGKST